MCNGYPAPRCSRHALNLLNDARNELEKSSNWATEEKAQRKLKKAEKTFYMTPAGFKFLEEEIKNATNPLVKDELFAKLLEGKQDRKDALINANRVKRENKTKLLKAKEMRNAGLSSWVIAGQLNVESLEDKGLEPIVSINTKDKHFDIAVDDKKLLAIKNKYSLPLGDIPFDSNQFSSSHVLGNIMNAYSSRGYNSEISSEELTFSQKQTVLHFVKNEIIEKGYSEIIVSDPRIGYSQSISVNELEEHFDIILFTPNIIKTGTDNLPLKELTTFLATFGEAKLAAPAIRVENKTIIETIAPLESAELYVGLKYFLTHLKDNFYVVKKLGNISSYTLRCVLAFNN